MLERAVGLRDQPGPWRVFARVTRVSGVAGPHASLGIPHIRPVYSLYCSASSGMGGGGEDGTTLPVSVISSN